jgi:hypothetical protein
MNFDVSNFVIDVSENKMSNTPEFQPSWISYLGAVSGILKSRGKDHDIIDVGGYSGWSFLINVMRGNTCPSGPTAHKAYDDILEGTRTLGVEISGYDDIAEYKDHPEDMNEYSPEVIEKRARNMFENFKREFDEEQNPVVLWGIPIPEYGIVYGYKDDSYLVSTIRRVQGIPETPIPCNKLQAPGSLHYFSFGKELEVNPKIRDRKAIERAIRMAEGETSAHEHYVAGPEAFVEWANVLQTGKKGEEVIYHGNSYVANCALEGRSTATSFLRRIAERYKDKSQHDPLINASNEFSKSKDLLASFVDLFPFALEGELPEEKRKQGAKLLLKIKPSELKAIKHLKKAIQVWE